MAGGWGYFSRKNKTITDINRGMLLQTIVRFIILDSPVGFEIPGEFEMFHLFIQFAGARFFLMEEEREL
ncbi:MAG: hypothetical protein P9M03_06000 [Candidatus Theseobacter exili]|nr:hypothetical protein [Candidatus Theseobacter exili]